MYRLASFQSSQFRVSIFQFYIDCETSLKLKMRDHIRVCGFDQVMRMFGKKMHRTISVRPLGKVDIVGKRRVVVGIGDI